MLKGLAAERLRGALTELEPPGKTGTAQDVVARAEAMKAMRDKR